MPESIQIPEINPPAKRSLSFPPIPKEATLIGLGVVAGMFLGLRVAKHLGTAAGGGAVPPAPSAAPPPGAPTVIHRAPCAECDERERQRGAANQRALVEHPLVRDLTDEEKAQVVAAATENGNIGAVLGAPPIGDVPE